MWLRKTFIWRSILRILIITERGKSAPNFWTKTISLGSGFTYIKTILRQMTIMIFGGLARAFDGGTLKSSLQYPGPFRIIDGVQEILAFFFVLLTTGSEQRFII